MKISTALILCAGFGKRLNPLTLKKPKPLFKLNNITMLENCINIIIKIGVKKIFLNTFHLSDQIHNFIEKKNFPIEIRVIDDGKNILDTGGGILNMMQFSKEQNFLIFNPDTLWHRDYIMEIQEMQKYYFLKNLDNILMSTNKKLSFDKKLKGDFKLDNNLLKKDDVNNYIYIGCQILNKSLFDEYTLKSFSISEIWRDLLEKNKLNGYESLSKFYHLTDLEIFKKLKDL